MSDETSVNNGVNVAALLEAREALTAMPEAAQFKWRASCNWENGTHSSSKVEGFFGLGEEQKHVREYSFDADHPEIFASEDKGATELRIRQLIDERARRRYDVTLYEQEVAAYGY